MLDPEMNDSESLDPLVLDSKVDDPGMDDPRNKSLQDAVPQNASDSAASALGAVDCSAADMQLNATLAALNCVQPPARLEQRIHARLSQEQLAPANSPAKLALPMAASMRAAVRQAWSLPRLAFAASAFVAGVATTVLVLPLLHGPTGNGSAGNGPARNAAASSPVAIQGAPVASHSSTPAGQPVQPVLAGVAASDAAPSYTVPGAGGRISAMSRAGAVAAIRARKQNSDPQLAANKQQHKGAEARLAKPVPPAADQPEAAQ